MARKPVLQSKLHNANKAMSNADMAVLRDQNSEQAQKYAMLARQKLEKKQESIDYYNTTTCSEIDPFFDTIQLTGRNIIVRMYKENYIKKVSEYSDGVPMYEAWMSQVDGRMRPTDQQRWVDNPLPYIFTGVIVAMSPLSRADQVKEEATFKEHCPNGTYVPLEVGSIVHLEHFMYADKRFYTDKQKRDFIRNPEEYKIEHWEGYVKVHPSMVEAVVATKAAHSTFITQTSPYAKYKETGEFTQEPLV